MIDRYSEIGPTEGDIRQDGDYDSPERNQEVRDGIRALREEYDILNSTLESLEKVINPALSKDNTKAVELAPNRLDAGPRSVADNPTESQLGQDLYEVNGNFKSLRYRLSNIIGRVRL